jgi:F-type H+-transporting ATP synthase subunit e
MLRTHCTQVLRYSALFFGIIYGFSHQRTLNANARAAHAENEYKHKESLIQKAKLEFAKKNMPQTETADGGGELFQRHSASSSSKLRNMPFWKSQGPDVLPNSYHQSGRQKLRPGSIPEFSVCEEHMIEERGP